MKENSLIIPVFLHLLFEIVVKSELKMRERFNMYKNTYFAKIDNMKINTLSLNKYK